jgi:hypothetical protein
MNKMPFSNNINILRKKLKLSRPEEVPSKVDIRIGRLRIRRGLGIMLKG